MSEKIKIKGNKIKVFETYHESDQIAILMTLFIIKYSLSGNTKSVQLKKIAFILDAVKKQVSFFNLGTLLSSPWEISDSLRKNIILAFEKGYILIKESQSVVSFSLSEQGAKLVDEIENLDIIPDIRDKLKKWCKAVSMNELKKQHLIW
jgi:hypothetical protein